MIFPRTWECVCVCVCARACMHMHTGGWFGDDSSALQLLCTLFLLLLQLLFRPSGTRSWQLESPDLNNRSLSCSLGGYTFNIKAVAGPRSLWRHQRRSVPGHTPGFWQFFGWKQLTPVFTWLSPHIPVSLFKYPFVWGHQTYCTRAHPTPVWPHFD